MRKNAAKAWGRPFERGNPGRPKGARHKTTILAEQLMADDVEVVVQAVIDKAKDGDMTAARIILDRLVPLRRGRPTPFTLPEQDDTDAVVQAFQSITSSLAAGELTAEEASAIASVLDAQRKAYETASIEARLEALENAVAK